MSNPLPIRRLLISILVVVASTLPVFLAGASFFQLETDIGLTPTSLGGITAVFFLTAAISSTPLGRLVERIGWRRAMQINCAVSGSVVVGIGLLAHSPLSLGVLLVAAGVAYGFANPAANQALAHAAPTSRRGLVFGLKHAGIPGATLVSGAAIPLLVLKIGWRPTYMIAIVFATVALGLIATEPARKGIETQRETTITPGLGNRQLIVIALGSSLATWTAVSLGTFLVAAAIAVSFSEAAAGVLLFVGSAASIIGRVAVGAIADVRRSRGFALVALMMTCGVLALLGMANSDGVPFAIAALAGFVFGWGWPGLLTYSIVRANEGTVASSSAITQAGIFLGAGASPIVIGWIIEHRSFTSAWVVVATMLALSALIMTRVAVWTRPVDA